MVLNIMKFLLIIILFTINVFAKEYWIVQNIGTLTLRLYEKECTYCETKIVFEKPIIVGKNEYNNSEDFRTMLGFYQIEKWHKFYVDGKESYIRWDGRKIPKRGSSRKQWGWQGAFGVYAATLTPNKYQHLHGTIGWPSESYKFIEHEKNDDGTLKRIGSKGCTRIDNQSIMFLRNFVPEKTPVIRIYAKEKFKNQEKVFLNEVKKWTYVFYEIPDIKKENPLSFIHRQLIKDIHILEIGEFIYMSKPSLKNLRARKDFVLNEINGNPYELELDEVGFFNVDTGILDKNYKHPNKLSIGGKDIPNIYFEK